MDYEEFNKGGTREQLTKKVINLLDKQPHTPKELQYLLGCSYSIYYNVLRELVENEVVIKRYCSGQQYIGLIKRRKNKTK